MESLTKKENELRTLAENGDYWDILELADFLYDGKRYEEAKECYLKIAGSDDLSGDANSHLFQMLLDMGEYEEALMYYGYVQNSCDTSPAEGAYVRMMEELSNPESKLFTYFDDESFYYDCLCFICEDYVRLDKISQLIDSDEECDDCGNVETGELYLKKNIETILLTRAKSEDEEIKKSAKFDLLWLYLNGSFRVGDFGFDNQNAKNIEKAIETSIVFAEHPDMIDEEYADFSYFYTAIDDIYGGYNRNDAKAYAKRLVIAILKRAEELGNAEDVLNKIESELYDEDYGFPFYLGYIPKGITCLPAISFSDGEWGNKELENIVIPDTITTISDKSFYNCTSLISAVIPESVTSIGDEAFFGCCSLTNIIIPAGVKNIGNAVFFGCESLTSVVIPDGVTSIGDSAFADCFRLTSIVIPASVTSIADDVFEWIGDWDYENDEDEECILTIKGYAGSCAESYAKEHGMLFEEI
jgi:hypothetical protein